jgi:hypothetical protein
MGVDFDKTCSQNAHTMQLGVQENQCTGASGAAAT